MTAIWNLIKRIWREVLLVCSLVSAVTLIYYWTVDRPEDSVKQSFMLIGIALSLVVACRLIAVLWRTKWRKVAMRGVQRLFARVQRFFERISQRLGIVRRSDKKVLGGKTTVTFDRIVDRAEAGEARAQKQPKWKQLETSRARMRYLYRAHLSAKLKKGAMLYASDTPAEVEAKLRAREEQTEGERALFEMYIDLRYDERRAPDEEQIKRLKKELDVK
jgi:hypothetical protein